PLPGWGGVATAVTVFVPVPSVQLPVATYPVSSVVAMTVEEGDPPPAGVRVPPPPVTLKVTVIPFIPTPVGVLTFTAGGVVTVPPSGAFWPEVGAAPVSKPRVSTVANGLNFLAVPPMPTVTEEAAAESG